MPIKTCCCSHMLWEHNDGGEGSCRVCGCFSCPKFHAPGEGHVWANVVLVLLILLVVAAVVFVASVVWRAFVPSGF